MKRSLTTLGASFNFSAAVVTADEEGQDERNRGKGREVAVQLRDISLRDQGFVSQLHSGFPFNHLFPLHIFYTSHFPFLMPQQALLYAELAQGLEIIALT